MFFFVLLNIIMGHIGCTFNLEGYIYVEIYDIFMSTQIDLLNTQLPTGSSCGHLTCAARRRWRWHNAGHQTIQQATHCKCHIMICKTEQEWHHKTLQANQNDRQQLIEALQRGAGIRTIGQEKMLQPKQGDLSINVQTKMEEINFIVQWT